MNAENEKLIKVKKSCKAVKIVALILLIVTMLGTILAFGSGIAIFVQGEKFDNMITEAEANGQFDPSDVTTTIGGVKAFDIAVGNPKNVESSIPALQAKFDEGSYSALYGLYLVTIGILLIVLNIILFLIFSVFGTIEKEATPFCDKVIHRMIGICIGLTVIMALTSGSGFGILTGFVSWAVITIMEYGKQLQIQSDETL